jgi:hypothetical protein
MTRWRSAAAPLAALVMAAGILAGGMTTPRGTPPVVDAALPAWHGGIDLYRRGVFTTQQTWLWCTAADIQISRNIVFHRTDHSASSQQAYFSWMRAHNRYRLPLSAGVDAQGWAAGFAHFVDGRYRLVVSSTFDQALRLAVIRLRATNLPVGITVEHGNHAWLITGFTATADPAVTSRFTVTSVRVVGPLYGLQSRNGYDMPPDTKLTPAQLRRFFTTWWYAPTRMVWDGRYVSIQPVPAMVTAPAPRPAPTPTRRPSRAPALSTASAAAPSPSSSAGPATASPDPSPAPAGSPGTAAASASPSGLIAAVIASRSSGSMAPAADMALAAPADPGPPVAALVVLAVVTAGGVIGAAAGRRRRPA